MQKQIILQKMNNFYSNLYIATFTDVFIKLECSCLSIMCDYFFVFLWYFLLVHYGYERLTHSTIGHFTITDIERRHILHFLHTVHYGHDVVIVVL